MMKMIIVFSISSDDEPQMTNEVCTISIKMLCLHDFKVGEVIRTSQDLKRIGYTMKQC